MTEGIVVLVAIIGVVVWVSYRVREGQELQSDWRQAAGDAGLQLTDEKTWGSLGIGGQAGQHRVLVEKLRTRQGVTGTRIVIEGSSGISLSREAWNTALEKKLGKREMQLGDEAFDREVHVLGSPEVVRAILDAAAREQWRRLLGGRIRLDGVGAYGFEAEVSLVEGRIQADFLEGWSHKLRANLAEVLTALQAVARKLEPPADLAARIAENTRTEPEWRVRVQNLILLAERYPEDPATAGALKRGCQDENDEVRLRAAIALKDEGRETLLEIATRESTEDGCAATAVAALGEHLPVAVALSILESALVRSRPGTVLACLGALGRSGGPAEVERLARVLAEEAPHFSVAAAEALGRVGSAAAVLPLKEAAAREDADGQLRRAARQAVAEIQSRLQGASPGQVSLAEGETGHLSLAEEDPAGRVSLPDARKAP